MTVPEHFSYDAPGRRIKKVDSVGGTTSIYYYNDHWQVLSEYNGSNSPQRWFAYGNYIDEVLVMNTTTAAVLAKLYVHDHLYSPVALVQMYHLDLKERYEYDAYGNCQIMDASYNPRASSSYGNPYYFTGRDMDALDGGNLKVMNYRHRPYDTYTGRFITHEPLGITPNSQWPNTFHIEAQYTEGSDLYEYAKTSPLGATDPYGLYGRADCWIDEWGIEHCDPVDPSDPFARKRCWYWKRLKLPFYEEHSEWVTLIAEVRIPNPRGPAGSWPLGVPHQLWPKWTKPSPRLSSIFLGMECTCTWLQKALMGLYNDCTGPIRKEVHTIGWDQTTGKVETYSDRPLYGDPPPFRCSCRDTPPGSRKSEPPKIGRPRYGW